MNFRIFCAIIEATKKRMVCSYSTTKLLRKNPSRSKSVMMGKSHQTLIQTAD